MESSPSHKTCILIPTCPTYKNAALLTVKLLDRYWQTHPPIFICGLQDDETSAFKSNVTFIDRVSDPLDWIGIALHASRILQDLGHSRVVLILDDQGPMDFCHVQHLDYTIHDWMNKLDAVYIRLQGWDHRRPSQGVSLGKKYLHLQRQEIDFPWRFSLQPSLWRLDVLIALLEIVHARADHTERSPWFFESEAGRLKKEVPQEWNGATFRICGREMTLQRERGPKRIILDLRDWIIRALHKTTFVPSWRHFAPIIISLIRPYDCYYSGPYPFHFAGFLREGKVQSSLLKVLEKRGEHELLAEILAAAP